MENRSFLPLALLSLCAVSGLSEVSIGEPRTHSAGAKNGAAPMVAELHDSRQKTNPSCRQWKGETCTVCGIDSPSSFLLKNKTKTPVLLCRDMKPGPARLEMTSHAEPAISGLWEVEFGLGYQTALRSECPHQFIASSNPPLKPAYEVGPINIKSEIPPDGMIQALACVGLSSAQVRKEGKETGASIKVFTLRVVSE